MRAIGLLAAAAMAGCGPDDGEDDGDALAACLPEPYRNTCIAEVQLDIYRTCLDGRGSCTWSEEERTDGVHHELIEWENGARVESTTSYRELSGTFQGASGARCAVSSFNSGECFRSSSDSRWYEYCLEFNEAKTSIVAYHYTCDGGERFTLLPADFMATSAMCAMLPPDLTSSENCLDAEGRRYGDVHKAPSDPKCQGASCGDVGARCTGDMPCDQGLTCRSLHVDPSVVYGYCTLGCDAATCPAGTECKNVAKPMGGPIERQCLRLCTTQADCDPYGTRCSEGVGACF
jgi:hypothetical protein